MVLRIGVLGSSEGNGHPFSFSAIVNGYDPERLRAAGWGAINAYLDARDPVDFGFPLASVTHAWCPDPVETTALCEATHIPNAAEAPETLLGEVDAVIVARDDWECHWELAEPFLNAGMPVFIDKPLSLDRHELEDFRPHLEAGRLMSCSGYRFAPELDGLRDVMVDRDRPLVLQGVGPRDWDRYAVHLVEPLLSLTGAQAQEVVRVNADHDAAVVTLSDGGALIVHCLGGEAPGFILNVTSARSRREIVLRDRFTAFRRLLGHFVQMIKDGEPAINPADTLAVMHVVIAGRKTRNHINDPRGR